MLDVIQLCSLSSGVSQSLQHNLKTQTQWHQPEFNFSGNVVKMPRLVAWYGDVDYRYSGIHHAKAAMPAWLRNLADDLSEQASLALGKPVEVNSVLCNWYRNGQDSISFHADDEAELGDKPVIISVSLGATRSFQFKENANPKNKVTYALTDGSVVVMYGNSQSKWKHGIPKEKHIQDERFNLTFRLTMPR